MVCYKPGDPHLRWVQQDLEHQLGPEIKDNVLENATFLR